MVPVSNANTMPTVMCLDQIHKHPFCWNSTFTAIPMMRKHDSLGARSISTHFYSGSSLVLLRMYACLLSFLVSLMQHIGFRGKHGFDNDNFCCNFADFGCQSTPVTHLRECYVQWETWIVGFHETGGMNRHAAIFTKSSTVRTMYIIC